MKFREEDIPLMHPMALQTARMFTTVYCRRHELSPEYQQDLANELGGTLHAMFTTIEEAIDAIATISTKNTPEFQMLFENFATMLKNTLRSNAIRADWDDSDGGEPVEIGPSPVVAS